MDGTFSADAILWAFIRQTDGVKGEIRVSMAGQPWGYVRIKGPGGTQQVIIERYNATVGLTEVHSSLAGVERRPTATPPPPITEHPLGTSSGPSVSPFFWGISADSLRKHYATPDDFVRSIVRSCAQAGKPW
jgi:hypothetical protein